jgi:prefoldin subunit 5
MVRGGIYAMESTENALKGVLTEYAEKILEALEALNQSISEIRRDIHIQALSSNTKIETNNNKIDSLLNHINGEVQKPNKKVGNLKKV